MEKEVGENGRGLMQGGKKKMHSAKLQQQQRQQLRLIRGKSSSRFGDSSRISSSACSVASASKVLTTSSADGPEQQKRPTQQQRPQQRQHQDKQQQQSERKETKQHRFCLDTEENSCFLHTQKQQHNCPPFAAEYFAGDVSAMPASPTLSPVVWAPPQSSNQYVKSSTKKAVKNSNGTIKRRGSSSSTSRHSPSRSCRNSREERQSFDNEISARTTQEKNTQFSARPPAAAARSTVVRTLSTDVCKATTAYRPGAASSKAAGAAPKAAEFLYPLSLIAVPLSEKPSHSSLQTKQLQGGAAAKETNQPAHRVQPCAAASSDEQKKKKKQQLLLTSEAVSQERNSQEEIQSTFRSRSSSGSSGCRRAANSSLNTEKIDEHTQQQASLLTPVAAEFIFASAPPSPAEWAVHLTAQSQPLQPSADETNGASARLSSCSRNDSRRRVSRPRRSTDSEEEAEWKRRGSSVSGEEDEEGATATAAESGEFFSPLEGGAGKSECLSGTLEESLNSPEKHVDSDCAPPSTSSTQLPPQRCHTGVHNHSNSYQGSSSSVTQHFFAAQSAPTTRRLCSDSHLQHFSSPVACSSPTASTSFAAAGSKTPAAPTSADVEHRDAHYSPHTGEGLLYRFLRTADRSSLYSELFTTTGEAAAKALLLCLDEQQRARCCCVCKLWYSEINSLSLLSAYFGKEGFPDRCRGIFWKLALLGEDIFCSPQQYQELAARPSASDAEILRDVGRTFPYRVKFQAPATQAALLRVLRAAANALPHVGYCQGMNFIAAVLLDVLYDDLAAYQCLISMLKNYQLEYVYLPSFQHVKVIVFEFDCLFKAFLPRLHRRFKQQHIRPDYYCIQWLMTLYSYELPMAAVHRLWDLFFLKGWKILFKTGLAILYSSRHVLLSLPYEETLRQIRVASAAATATCPAPNKRSGSMIEEKKSGAKKKTSISGAKKAVLRDSQKKLYILNAEASSAAASSLGDDSRTSSSCTLASSSKSTYRKLTVQSSSSSAEHCHFTSSLRQSKGGVESSASGSSESSFAVKGVLRQSPKQPQLHWKTTETDSSGASFGSTPSAAASSTASRREALLKSSGSSSSEGSSGNRHPQGEVLFATEAVDSFSEEEDLEEATATTRPVVVQFCRNAVDLFDSTLSHAPSQQRSSSSRSFFSPARLSAAGGPVAAGSSDPKAVFSSSSPIHATTAAAASGGALKRNAACSHNVHASSLTTPVTRRSEIGDSGAVVGVAASSNAAEAEPTNTTTTIATATTADVFPAGGGAAEAETVRDALTASASSPPFFYITPLGEDDGTTPTASTSLPRTLSRTTAKGASAQTNRPVPAALASVNAEAPNLSSETFKSPSHAAVSALNKAAAAADSVMSPLSSHPDTASTTTAGSSLAVVVPSFVKAESSASCPVMKILPNTAVSTSSHQPDTLTSHFAAAPASRAGGGPFSESLSAASARHAKKEEGALPILASAAKPLATAEMHAAGLQQPLQPLLQTHEKTDLSLASACVYRRSTSSSKTSSSRSSRSEGDCRNNPECLGRRRSWGRTSPEEVGETPSEQEQQSGEEDGFRLLLERMQFFPVKNKMLKALESAYERYGDHAEFSVVRDAASHKLRWCMRRGRRRSAEDLPQRQPQQRVLQQRQGTAVGWTLLNALDNWRSSYQSSAVAARDDEANTQKSPFTTIADFLFAVPAAVSVSSPAAPATRSRSEGT